MTPYRAGLTLLPREIEAMRTELLEITTKLCDAVSRGERDLEDRLRVLHATALAAERGERVNVTITAKKRSR